MERKRFLVGDEILLRHYEDKTYIDRKFIVQYILGEGASCITYFVKYKEDNSYSQCGVLKEFNPISDHISIDKFLDGYKLQSKFSAEIENAKNITSNTEGIYSGNNTKYILMSCNDGTSYDNIKEENIQDIIKTSISICRAVKVYHDANYLHLDIKPSNIFILPETRELVKLFDFDSVHKKSELLNCRLSYSIDWAAPELLYGEKNYKICEATDIYSIGTIIFSKIMGRMPLDKEKQRFSKFEFNKVDDIFKNVSPKIFNMLTTLFRNTLQIDVSRRYKTVDKLEEFLLEILDVVSGKTPFLADLRWSVSPNSIGRENEFTEIHKRLKEDNTVFIRAMGGIGKSELAKMYAEKYKDKYDIIQFVTFDNNLKNTIVNNLLFSNLNENDYIINGENHEESIFKGKIKLFEDFDEKTLIIIDNFNVSFDKDIDSIITSKNNGYKVIFTTRNFNEDFEDKYFELNTMNEDTCLELYYKFYGNMKKHREDNASTIKNILKVISYNTLLIKLIALNCKKQRIKPEVMLEKLEKCELSTVKGKIRHTSDIPDDMDNNKLMYEHLATIFNLSGLKKNEKFIMMNLSLISRIKIDASKFGDWCNLEDFDDINSLVESGWIELDIKNDMLSLHHIISDLAYEELKPDAEKCSGFISSLAEIVNNNNYKSYYEKNYYLSFCRVVAKKINGSSEQAAYFFVGIGKILSEREDDTDECLNYLFKALNTYINIHGEYSIKALDIYFYLLVTYKTLSCSFNMFYDENSDEEIWGKIQEYTKKYILINKELFKEDENKIAEVYLKIGKVYKSMLMPTILCLEGDFEEIIADKTEEYYLKYFTIKERVFSDDNNELKKAANVLYEFYSDLMNPKNSEEKANFYKYKYNLGACAYVNGEEIKPSEIEYCFEMGLSSEIDNDFQKAIDYYKKALKCDDEDGMFYTHTGAYIKIIKLYKENKKYNEALKYCSEMLYKCVSSPFSEKAEVHYLLGTIYIILSQYDLAIESFSKSKILWNECLNSDEACSDDYCYKELLCCNLKLGQSYEEKFEYNKAEKIYLEAFDLYKKLKDMDKYMAEDIVELYECLGNIEVEKHNYDKAFYYYMIEAKKLIKSFDKNQNEQATIICKKILVFLNKNLENNKEKIIETYLNIGNAYSENELNIKKALEYYLKGLKMSSELYNSEHYVIAQFYHKIGEIYCYKFDDKYDEGNLYLNKCNYKSIAEHKVEKYLKNPLKKFKVYEEVGDNYLRVDKYEEGVHCFNKALDIVKDNIGNFEQNDLSYYDYIRLNDNIARCYTYIKEYEKALEYEKDSLQIIIKSLKTKGYYNTSFYQCARKYIDIGELYLEKEEYEECIKSYLCALKYYEENYDDNVDNIIRLFNKIIDVYKKNKNYEQVKIYEDKIKDILGNEIEL
ncbi:UNVERIFIED_ORG: hypothetical protein B2H95_05650 [Clostridium botulinum]